MKKGFTLIEVLIAIGIFVLVSSMASNILINFSILEKKTNIQNVIYEDIRIIITQLSNLIESGTIDYEEYYSINVIQSTSDQKHYGLYNGIYSSRFYSPGLSGGENPDDLGINCHDFPDCNLPNSATFDNLSGLNPYDASAEASAFCDESLETSPVSCDDISNEVEELYLIDKTGTKKTIVAKKLIDNDSDPDHYALAVLEMEGDDYDQNGIIDLFSCTSDFNCHDEIDEIYNLLEDYTFISDIGRDYISDNNIRLAQQSDLEVPFNIASTQFIPISPLRVNIEELTFTINPVENPYLAYNERSSLYHPSVSIRITIGLSEQEALNYPGEFESITFETSISAGVIGEIVSYPPVSDSYATGESSWIVDLF